MFSILSATCLFTARLKKIRKWTFFKCGHSIISAIVSKNFIYVCTILFLVTEVQCCGVW